MNKENTNRLLELYPKILIDDGKPMYIGVGDGWAHLLDMLMLSIQDVIDNPNYMIKQPFIRWIGEPAAIWYNRNIGGKLSFKFRGQYVNWACLKWTFCPPDAKRRPKQVVVEQIKEKFGGLRFYFRGGNAEISGMVKVVEMLSYRICELCGKPMSGTTKINGWISARCSECRPK